ncbi:MAG: ABC transporter permease [Chloroflexi bacterium]|nr:ABC transporter permease [Chloroflexota bacterium]
MATSLPRFGARLSELSHYHELISNLVVRDLKVRYKNSVLGFLWSLVNPMLMMLVFTIVFGIMLSNQDIPNYPVFLLCGILPWNFFSTALSGAIQSIVNNAQLVKKVYFPREVLPISTVLANLVNFLLALLVLFAMMLIFRIPLTIWAILLPVVILIQVIFTLGLGFFLATLNVFYRDTSVIMEVLLLAWFFLTPIFYNVDILPAHRVVLGIDMDIHRLVYILNPIASLVASYRVILYTGAPPAWDFFSRTLITSVVFLVAGYLFFTRFSPMFGEEV